MWMFNGKCRSKARLTGKTAVVTGCNTGIGKTTVVDFVKRGCRVIMACRDVTKAEDAAEDIRKATAGVEGVGVIVVVRLDLSSFASVRECAEKILQAESQINILVNNAGVAFARKSLTVDGFETHFGTNHLGHFLLTMLLLPKILLSAPARIVVVSSLLHLLNCGGIAIPFFQGADIDFDDLNMDKSYTPLAGYERSKLSNILFAAELGRRLTGSGVTTYSLHPGAVTTNVFRNMNTCCFPGAEWVTLTALKFAGKTVEEGAQTTIRCAVDEKLAAESGLYYSNCKKARPWSKARDPVLAMKLFRESLKMVGLENQDVFAGCGSRL